MAEQHLIQAVLEKYRAMPAHQRIEKVQKLARQLEDDRKFIQRVFPELYHEAFAARP